MRGAPLLLLAIAAGCAAPSGHAPPARAPGDDTADTRSVADADALVAALREAPEDTLQTVSEAGGWPQEVEDGWLFVQAAPGDWSLAGDFEGWTGVPMTRDDGFSWVVVRLEGPSGYKFTDGRDWNPDPWSRQYTYDDFGEMSLVLAEEAHLERLFAVTDGALAPRTVRAWVPAGEADRVLYAQDGQNLFDPEAIWGGWRLQESAPESVLIVGIDNTADRMDEYTHVPDLLDGEAYGGEGDRYAAFVQDTVRPLVRATWGEHGPIGLLGSSLGGLISFHVADRYPGEYAFAASLSGTMGWGSIGADNETMIARYAAAGYRGTALYLDSGGGGGDCADADGDGTHDDDPENADNYCENLQLRDTLAAVGYRFDIDLWHWWEPGASHDEAAWAARVERPLAIFAGL